MHETLREAKRVEAEQRREALRAELHRYGALEDEPDLESHARGTPEYRAAHKL